MFPVYNEDEVKKFEKMRALVGTYLDRNYDAEKITWLMTARRGFNDHARGSWHLLIPARSGYALDNQLSPADYDTTLANKFINDLELKFNELPAVVFRGPDDAFFYLKLGGKSKEEFFQEIGTIADIARQCQKEYSGIDDAYRSYVNMQVANHLFRSKLLSAGTRAAPKIAGWLGFLGDVKDFIKELR